MSDTFLTTAQLAERWQMDERTLANWRQQEGRGPVYVKLGRGNSAAVRYRLQDVIAYENKQRRKDSKQ